MVALSVQQSFWSVFRKLRINIAVHIIYICHQSKSLYNQNLCPKHIYQHASWITNACQIQSDGVFARVSLLYRLSEPLQTPPPNDCFVCKSCSTSIALSRKIQVPSEFKCQFSTNPFMVKYMKPRSPSKYVKWLAEVLLSVEQPGPFKFQFSPQRCDRQNLNEKLFHLFLQNNELYYQVYLHTVGNICDSRGEVKEQSVVNITSQLFTI